LYIGEKLKVELAGLDCHEYQPMIGTRNQHL